MAKDTHRFRVVNCGRRWGKTTLAVWEMIAKAAAKNDQRVVYLAPTYQQARDIAWMALVKASTPLHIKVNETRLELILKTQHGGQSLITLHGWESVEALRGTGNDFLVPDEVAMYRDFWSNWHEVLRPTLTDTRGEALFLSTPKGFNHFYDLYNEENKDTDYKSFHFTSLDNSFLPQEELEKARKELTEDRFAQEYLADFRKTEGLVYKEFSRDRHLFDSNVKGQELGAIDFGFTNPCAVLRVVKDSDSSYWVKDEWYKTGRTEAQIADYVVTCGFEKVYADPESPSAIEVLNQKGIRIAEVAKGKDSIMSGINRIRELFKANKIHIHKSCVNLINELETYSYPDRKDLRNEEEKPIKENDHALDALRYLIMMDSIGTPIAAVQLKQERQWMANQYNQPLNSTK